MLKAVSNPHNHPSLARLNDKIKKYQKLDKRDLSQKGLLLEEISYMVNALKAQHLNAWKRLLDYRDQNARALIDALQPIVEWNGLPAELAKISSQPVSTGLKAELDFIHSQHGVQTFHLNPLMQHDDKFQKFIKQEIHLISMAAKLSSEEENIAYFYNLREMKQDLLEALCFDSQFSNEDLIVLRSMLAKVNRKIEETIDRTPQLHSLYDRHSTASEYRFVQNIANMSMKERMELSVELLHNAKQNQMEAILSKLISLGLPQNCEITRLGDPKGNNLNLCISLPDSAEEFVLKLEKTHATPEFFSMLSNTPLQQSFLEEFYSSQPDLGQESLFTDANFAEPYSLYLTEYAKYGNLRNETETLHQQGKDPEFIAQSAVQRLRQLLDLYHSLKRYGGGHLDIKLTNFLMNENQQLVLGDKKEIFQRSLPPVSCESTPAYIPPELINPPLIDGRIDPDCIDNAMMYQMGLAMYEYIVCPDSLENWNESLNFNLPCFETATGQAMRDLIMHMTAPIYNFQDISVLKLELFPGKPEKMAQRNTFYIDEKSKTYVFCDAQENIHQGLLPENEAHFNKRDLKEALVQIEIEQKHIPETARFIRPSFNQCANEARNIEHFYQDIQPQSSYLKKTFKALGNLSVLVPYNDSSAFMVTPQSFSSSSFDPSSSSSSSASSSRSYSSDKGKEPEISESDSDSMVVHSDSYKKRLHEETKEEESIEEKDEDRISHKTL